VFEQEVAYDTAGRLIEEWFSLLDYCQGGMDPKLFKQRTEKWAKEWARLPYDEQGEISHVINHRLRFEWDGCLASKFSHEPPRTV